MKIDQNNPGPARVTRQRRDSRGWAAAVVLLALAACTAKGPESARAGPDIAGTVHVCSSCHGPGGHSTSSTFPRLAGQQKDYLTTQLKAFRDHTRADPHAKTYMWGMAAQLSDPVIAGIAAYYAAQPPVPRIPNASPEAAAGAKIYAAGIPARGVPACATCHGGKGQGKGTFPRLAGQHRAYIARQLAAFASKARANGIMHAISKDLTAAEIKQVAAYLRTM